jgi:TIR domain
MALKPAGFWSYTASDDLASHGRLSQLRDLLTDEVQGKVGRLHKVTLFQDVTAIPYGSDWEKQINKAIDGSSFFVPLITPAFLQSQLCCRESTLFRRRQNKLVVRMKQMVPVRFEDFRRFPFIPRVPSVAF